MKRFGSADYCSGGHRGVSGITCRSERNQDLARNLLPRMTGGGPGLRAFSKEIRIWHVIYCLGCRAGARDYVPFQKKTGFGT